MIVVPALNWFLLRGLRVWALPSTDGAREMIWLQYLQRDKSPLDVITQ
jgi:hypothetical protein